jgi:hypothetical protein
MRRLATIFAFAFALIFLDGCSLLGLAVGSQIPHFDPVSHATRGDALRIHFADSDDALRGAAVAVTESSITVLDEDGHDHVIDKKRIDHMERRHGSEWMSTLIAGAVIDGLTVTSLIIAAALGAFH